MYILTDEQQKFLNGEGNVVLSACPGSGKTYVVARKLLNCIQAWEYLHQGVAVLSFTNVASQEIEKQAKQLMYEGFKIDYPHFVGTIDSFINTFILLRFGYLMMKDSPKRPTIVVNNLCVFPFRFWRAECHRQGCIHNIQEFRWGIDGTLFRKKEKVTCTAGPYGIPCNQYKRQLLKKGYVFQGEVAALSYLLLKKHPEIAMAIAARFPIIIIDEAQDTSVEQVAIFDLLSEAGVQSMFFVGDPDQSIYEWRSATPQCFLEKMDSTEWKPMTLTANFRSSQLICNATQAFAYTLNDKNPSTAKGKWAEFLQKPVLILYDENINEQVIIDQFLELCQTNNIPQTATSIAVVTRGRIHKNTNVVNLWKSQEIKILAQSAFEWYFGARRKAFELCEQALFSMTMKNLSDVETTITKEIENIMPYETWKSWVISILCNLPSPEKPVAVWIQEVKSILIAFLDEQGLPLRNGTNIDEVIKIKTRDQKIPGFKDIPMKDYFEVKTQSNITVSSVHGVKGETFDGILLLVRNKTGANTLTPTFLTTGDLDSELMRITYVAMTRPRKLLVVAMPNIKKREKYSRFPEDKWEYIYLV